MMKWKRFTALLLAAAMLLGLLAGCRTGTAEATDASEAIRSDIGSNGLALSQGDNKRLISATARAPGDAAVKDYTIMVYMVGSNLESQGGYASSDILEMLDSGMKGENNNLLVYTGGAASWDLNIRSDVNTVYALNAAGDSLDEVAYTSQPANMGDADTLLDFLNYAYNNYPAEKYGLICWDHGGGPLFGFGSDELFENDGLSIWELQAALDNSPFAQETLEFVGFDACLMASLEVAALLSGYAAYMIASEEVEPGSGWDYSFLKTLNTTNDTLTLARSILEAYQISMEADFWEPEYTLSCVDLSMLANVVGSLDGVWARMRSELNQGGFSAIARSRNQTKRFGMSAVSDRGSSYDLVDVGDMMNKLGSGYDELTQTVWQHLDLAVVEQVTNVENTSGLSMYYPYDNKELYSGGGQFFDFSGLLGSYHSFMDRFADQWLTAESDISLNDSQTIQVREDCLTLQLEPEQLTDLGSVTYTVLQYEEEADAYSGILTGFEVMPDENGVISIPRNPDVFMLHTDAARYDDEGALWPVTLVESGVTKNNYVSYSSALFSSLDFIIGGTEPIQITLADDRNTGEVVIQSILSRSWADSEFYGKQDVRIDNWGIVAYNWNPLYPTYDTEGNLLPWQEWESDGSFWYTYSNYEEYFYFEKAQLQDLEGRFYCQVVMKDTSGNVIGTRMEELYSNTPYEDQTVALPEGTMTFRVYGDHAVLTGFQAKDDGDSFSYADYEVAIPASVGGVPVTVIGHEAFANCMDIKRVTLPDTIVEIEYNAFASAYNLTDVNIPAGVKIIGNRAFGWTGLTQVTLPEGLEELGYQSFAGNEFSAVTIPASVKRVGAGTFAYCEELTAIHAAAGNEEYKSVDGVLFSADGTRLVAFPAAKGEKYDVPAGVEIIGDEAFRGNEMITTLNFPEGLRIIERLAFCDADGLLYIRLPESLEIIGNAAFGDSTYADPRVAIPTLEIGPNVSWVGYDAFAGYDIRAFAVDGENAYYSAANGCLLNASGTRLIQAPYAHEGKLTVPEGVSYIAWNAFDSCDLITELVLPDSVVAINHAAGVPRNLNKLVVGKGLTDWQNVTSYFTVLEIEIDPENPNYTITEDGSIYTKDMTKLLLCRSEAADVVIPEGVTAIGVGAMKSMYGDAATMKSLSLPASLVEIPENAFCNLMALERFEVAAGNPSFAAYDGLLYSKDGKTLVACPVGRTGTVEVREGTLEIGPYAFYSVYLKASSVVIHEGATVLRFGNFTSSPYNNKLSLYLPGSLTDIHAETFRFVDAEDMIICCPAGSAADTMARALGLTVVNQ